MSESIVPARAASRPNVEAEGWATRVAKKLVCGQLSKLPEGAVTLVDSVGVSRFGPGGDLQAAVTVRDPQFYVDVLLSGSLGAAESYIGGRWEADDLTALIRIFARNVDLADSLEQGWARPASFAARLLHKLRDNTRRGSGKNVRAHYDLGNDFFRLFLDPTMNYSSAIFDTPGQLLEEAQVAKMDRICRKLELTADDHLLEIGTGWGAMAMHAARRYGSRVTTTTISPEQHRLASERVRAAGLEDRITILLRDYRDLEGSYDKLVSVEMIEAVGDKFLGEYFERCGALLTPDGLMLLQGITMAEHRYDDYLKRADFIQQFVFPGSCLPSVGALVAAAGRSSDLRPAHLEDFTPHYAETLRRWRSAFEENLSAVRELGYSDEFIRLWRYYLCYCEAGFEEGACGEVQLMFAKPRRRRETPASTAGRKVFSCAN